MGIWRVQKTIKNKGIADFSQTRRMGINSEATKVSGSESCKSWKKIVQIRGRAEWVLRGTCPEGNVIGVGKTKKVEGETSVSR